jgi:NADH-quinone oxidoreductase E subunit
MYSEEQRAKIEALKKRYQRPQAVVMAALWMWQENEGWISDEGMKAVADILGLPMHHVLGVVSFYTMYNRKPVGKHKIEVCTNVSCMLRKSEKILRHIESTLHITVGQTTADKKFTLVEAECLGSCGTAPMMQIGDKYYENLDEDKVNKILAELK